MTDKNEEWLAASQAYAMKVRDKVALRLTELGHRVECGVWEAQGMPTIVAVDGVYLGVVFDLAMSMPKLGARYRLKMLVSPYESRVEPQRGFRTEYCVKCLLKILREKQEGYRAAQDLLGPYKYGLCTQNVDNLYVKITGIVSQKELGEILKILKRRYR